MLNAKRLLTTVPNQPDSESEGAMVGREIFLPGFSFFCLELINVRLGSCLVIVRCMVFGVRQPTLSHGGHLGPPSSPLSLHSQRFNIVVVCKLGPYQRWGAAWKVLFIS